MGFFLIFFYLRRPRCVTSPLRTTLAAVEEAIGDEQFQRKKQRFFFRIKNQNLGYSRRSTSDLPDVAGVSAFLRTRRQQLERGFTGFYWVLPSLDEVYWVLLGFTGFYWVLLGFA